MSSTDRGETVLSKVLTAVAALLPTLVPIYVAYDLYDRGQVPEKRIELRRYPPINPLNDLSPLGEGAVLSLKMKDDMLNNIVIGETSIRNAGRSPVFPNEYDERLSVSVSSPWKIVAVENSTRWAFGVEFRWNRVSETRFEAEPALLNPGDFVVTLVYLTNTQFVSHSDMRRAAAAEPEVEWDARITNMRSFQTPPCIIDRGGNRSFPIHVYLYDWSLVFTVGCALLFQCIYLYLLREAVWLDMWNWVAIGVIVCASMLSFGTAEAISTYLFYNYIYEIGGVNHLLNIFPILLHLAVLWLLSRQAKRVTRVDSGDT